MMIKYIIITSIFFMTTLFAITLEERGQIMTRFRVSKSKNFEERLYTTYVISEKHRSGTYLIYECKERKFICVDDESFDKCREERRDALNGDVFLKLLPCAPLKKFEDIFDCHDEIYKNMYRMSNKRFCIHPRYSQSQDS